MMRSATSSQFSRYTANAEGNKTMKYIVKVEIRVYESEGEMTDVIENTLKITAPNLETAETFGNKLVDTVTAQFRAVSKKSN
jgi:hypothetical protein